MVTVCWRKTCFPSTNTWRLSLGNLFERVAGVACALLTHCALLLLATPKFSSICLDGEPCRTNGTKRRINSTELVCFFRCWIQSPHCQSIVARRCIADPWRRLHSYPSSLCFCEFSVLISMLFKEDVEDQRRGWVPLQYSSFDHHLLRPRVFARNCHFWNCDILC